MKHRIMLFLWLFVSLIIMTVIFIFSSQSADSSQELSNNFLEKIRPYLGDMAEKLGFKDGGIIRKWAHFFEFMCLGFSGGLFWAEFFLDREKRITYAAFCDTAGGFLYACSDEIHQIFVPGRSSQLTDVGIDFVGIVIGAAVCMLGIYLYNRKMGVSSDG